MDFLTVNLTKDVNVRFRSRIIARYFCSLKLDRLAVNFELERREASRPFNMTLTIFWAMMLSYYLLDLFSTESSCICRLIAALFEFWRKNL